MIKDKEWLKEAVGELNLVVTEFEADGMCYMDRAVSVTQVYDLIDQLDELEKVVIPKFVAEAFEKAKVDNWFATSLINVMYDSSDEVAYWLEVPSNEKLLLRAWLEGYEVEKEKLYYVKLPNTNSKSEYLYLAQGSVSGDCWFNSSLERLDYEANACKHKFTEQEIKNYDERYWAFAVEVTE